VSVAGRFPAFAFGTAVIRLHDSRAFFAHRLEKSARFPLLFVVKKLSTFGNDLLAKQFKMKQIKKLFSQSSGLANRLQ
jgi:hypothetical protein